MRTIIFILSLFIIISCDKPNDNKQQEQHNDLYGSWYLIEERDMAIYSYTNEIKWTFDNDSVHISIANGTDVPPDSFLFTNGNYLYNLYVSNNNNYIAFHSNSTERYKYKITNDTLLLDNFIGTDGVLLTLIKIN